MAKSQRKARTRAGRPRSTPGGTIAISKKRRASAEQPAKPARADSKQAKLIELLRRPEGATLAQLVKALGWQAHTVRGAMSGALKKKLGLTIVSEKSDGARVYRIA
nr:DUF3489 domain-containing protein [Nitrosomonas nitrosa]